MISVQDRVGLKESIQVVKVIDEDSKMYSVEQLPADPNQVWSIFKFSDKSEDTAQCVAGAVSTHDVAYTGFYF